jgi:hypothetical protein
MLYLLDANVLITAHSSYYAVDRVPEYWEWLRHMGEEGHVAISQEIYEEIKDGPDDEEKDLLFAWLQQDAHRDALLLDEEVDQGLVNTIVTTGYANDLTDEEIDKLGRDPFLLAYALAQPNDRCVVTVEVSKPTKVRANRQVPDVCNSLGLQWCDPHAMNKKLGFRTNWKAA